MTPETAKEIAELTCNKQRRLIDAIRLLRADTAMGLLQAKKYLEDNGDKGEVVLFQILCDDFVQNKKDLLIIAQQEVKRLQKYIEQLEFEIGEEDLEISHAEIVDKGITGTPVGEDEVPV
jgi:hypothetical protein